MLMMDPNAQPYLKSLTSCLNKVVEEGFTEEFKVLDDSVLALKSGRLYAPDALEVINSFRFAGKQHPNEDMLLLILQTYDGIKGTLITRYEENGSSTPTGLPLHGEKR